jgi:hypothetical protein
MVTTWDVRIHDCKSIVNGNEERDITYCWFCFSFNLKFQWQFLSQRNDKFVTVHNKHSNTPWKTSTIHKRDA